MKNLENLNVARLGNLEFGQHIKSIVNNINLLGTAGTIITDAVILQYINSLNTSMIPYDKSLLHISKSDETEKIVQLDKMRDTAVSAASRYLNVFELSDVEAERLAFASLETVFKMYKGIQNWNFEEESNGIDNLVVELESAKYLPHVAALQMNRYILRMKASNDAFKTVFAKRTQEESSKEVIDVKTIRTLLATTYSDMANYILSMSKVQDTEQYNQTLSVINTVRKYYADLLAKRKTVKAGETPVPIPQM